MSKSAFAEPTTIAQGTPVTIATTVQQPSAPAPNPLTEPRNVMELGALVLLVAGVFALFTRWLDRRRKEDADNHKSVHALQDREIGDLRHDLGNARSRIDALEHLRTDDIQRMVAMETNLANIKEGQARIEHAVGKMAVDLGNRIDQLGGAA